MAGSIYFQILIHIREQYCALCHTVAMMTSDLCYQRAETCEMRGAGCGEPMRADWLDMAAKWRRLGDDGSAQGTTARLMREAHTAG